MPDDIKFPEGENPAEAHEPASPAPDEPLADTTKPGGLPQKPSPGRPKPA